MSKGEVIEQDERRIGHFQGHVSVLTIGALCFGASHFTSLSLCFFISKMGRTQYLFRKVTVRIKTGKKSSIKEICL